jgi:hypothetical protein
VLAVPEFAASARRSGEAESNILSLKAATSASIIANFHLTPSPSITPTGDMGGAENGQPGPMAKVSEVVSTYRPTRVSDPSARLCSPPQPQH